MSSLPAGTAVPLLQVRGLTVRYEPEGQAPVLAVDGVSFDVAEGEAVGLLGESGCGKTTTGLSILGLQPPGARVVDGSVKLQGRELRGLPEREMESVRGALASLIFQEPGLALNPVLRVGDQVAEVIRAHHRWGGKRSREEAREVLARVRLDAARLYDAYPHELSGGQRQRVGIAQAVACRPPLVIADEPTAALDSTTQVEILALLDDLKRRLGLALLLISHSLRTLSAVADRILVMQAGRIVEEGPAARVLEAPQHPHTRALLKAHEDLRRPRRGLA
jgi:ABC-type glutathione transport system ATPase component